jgi:multidrug efflux pump subunit AcrA (membrane-fusion protein)
VVPVDVHQTRATVTLGGTVVPYKEVTLSAQLPGRVKFLAGTEGDQFEEGTVLAELDDNELRAQHQAAMAAMRDADTAMRSAGVQYSRELVAPGKGSPSTMPGMGMPSLFDQFFTRPMGSMIGQGAPGLERGTDLYLQGAQIEQARNAFMRAQSQLQQVASKFRDAKSIAPFTGVIVKKMVEVGDTVQPGQPLLQFADTQYLQIQVEVPARLMPGVREGMWVRARLDVRNTSVNVRVAQIFPMADPQRHTVRVKFDLPAQAPAAPGMYAEAMVPDVNAPVRQVLVIPAAAVVQRGSLPMVEVVKDQNQKELRIVRLGEYLDPYHVTVLSGLKPGEFVSVGGSEPAGGGGGGWTSPPGAAPPAPIRQPPG